MFFLRKGVIGIGRKISFAWGPESKGSSLPVCVTENRDHKQKLTLKSALLKMPAGVINPLPIEATLDLGGPGTSTVMRGSA